MHENHDISYVLLLGGRKGQSFNWFVPVRYVHLDDGTGTYTSYFTDLYFADLYKEDGSFEDWDSNDNDLFGEFTPFNGDNLDLNPDISVGRIPCRTKKEAESIIEKIISYENTAYGSSWFHTAVMVGGDTFPNAEGYEGEQVCDYASQFLQDFSIEKLYATTGAITTSTDLVSAINAGCGFVFTRAKGGQDRVRVVTSDNEEIIALHNRDISSLSYDERYPIMILGECIHAKFDVTILNIFHYLFGHPNYFRSDCLFDCIAGKLVHKEHGGAIAVLTNVNLCYGSNGDENQNEIPDDAENYGGFLAVEALRIYIEEQKNILGDVFLQTQQEYVDTFPVHSDKNECKSIQDWILIGDPTLKIGGYPSS